MAESFPYRGCDIQISIPLFWQGEEINYCTFIQECDLREAKSPLIQESDIVITTPFGRVERLVEAPLSRIGTYKMLNHTNIQACSIKITAPFHQGGEINCRTLNQECDLQKAQLHPYP